MYLSRSIFVQLEGEEYELSACLEKISHLQDELEKQLRDVDDDVCKEGIKHVRLSKLAVTDALAHVFEAVFILRAVT